MVKYYKIFDDRHAVTNYRWYKDIVYRHFPVLIEKKNCIRFLRDLDTASDYEADDREMSESEWEALSIKRIRDWDSQVGIDVETGEVSGKARDVQKKNREVFVRFCRMCKEEKLDLVIVIPPFSDIFNRHLDEDFIEAEYEGFLGRLAGEEGIAIYNYRRDARFEDRREYFRNVDCLNRRGAEVFTRIVMGDVCGDDRDR